MESSAQEKQVLAFLKSGIRAHEAKLFDLIFIEQQGLTIKLLLTYAYHQDTQVAFRASWLLEHTVIKTPTCITEVYDEFMDRLSSQKNWSCIRSFSKIGMLVTKPPRQLVEQKNEHEELWIEQSFNWIIASDCPVAVVVNCLDILYFLSDKYDWVKEELRAQIAHLLKNPTPALASRAKRILKRIL